MLDGAARIADVVATAAADGQPAVGITDHGNMYGVLDFYKAAREADLTPVIGTEAYMVTTSRHERPRRDEHDIYHLTLLAESTQGYQQPHQGVVARVPRRLLHQAPRRLRAARAVPRGTRRHHRLPRRRGVAGAAARRLRRRARARRAVPVRVRSRLVLRRAPGPRAPGAARRQPAPDPAGARPPCAAARDQRQPLHPPRGRGVARRAPLRADRQHARRPEALQVRRRRVLPEDRGGDAPPLPRLRRGVRQHAADRRARATSRSSSAPPRCRASRCPSATTRTRTSASSPSTA